MLYFPPTSSLFFKNPCAALLKVPVAHLEGPTSPYITVPGRPVRTIGHVQRVPPIRGLKLRGSTPGTTERQLLLFKNLV